MFHWCLSGGSVLWELSKCKWMESIFGIIKLQCTRAGNVAHAMFTFPLLSMPLTIEIFKDVNYAEFVYNFKTYLNVRINYLCLNCALFNLVELCVMRRILKYMGYM